MLGVQRQVSRDDLILTPFGKMVLDAIEEGARKHLKHAEVTLVDCGNCDRLHVHVTDAISPETDDGVIHLGIHDAHWKRK